MSASITAGSIAFVGVNSENPDQFAFVALQDIGGGQSVFITDGGYTGTLGTGSQTFRATEGFLQWTAPTLGLAAGSVVLVNAGGGSAPSVSLNGGGEAGTVGLLANSGGATNNFSFSSAGDQLTAYTTTGGTHLTGSVGLVAFLDYGVNPYGSGSANASSIPTITGGQVLDLGNLDNAVVKVSALDPANGVAFYSNAANYNQQDTTRYDLSLVTTVQATTIGIDSVSLAEGNAGTTAFTFTVSRSNNAGAFTLAYATADGTAVAGSDYTAASGTLTFAAGGALSQTITVTVAGDTPVESDETFAVTLSNLLSTAGSASLGTATGMGTILNDDAAGTVSVAGASVVEGNGGTANLVFTVTRTDTASAFTVNYATADGTATAGSDYAAASGMLTFEAGGPASQTITVPVTGDTAVEPDETLTVTLSGLVNQVSQTAIQTATATGTIVNDDVASAPNVWMNEFHYDNAGADTGEFIELAGTAGTDLTGWQIIRYNGNVASAAVVYTSPGTISLGSVVIPNQANGFGTVSVSLPQDGLQNGPNDGFALVDAGGAVVQLLSYEGVFTAGAGAASGQTSTDVGVSESGSATGTSIGLVGSGTDYSAFTWALLTTATPSQVNAGQSFGGGAAGPSVSVDDVSVAEGNSGTRLLTFTVSRSDATTAFTLDYATADGTAAAGSDYATASGTLSFAVGGALTQTVSVTINGDTAGEADETLLLNLSNLQDASGTTTIADAQGLGTILNDDVSFVRIFDIQGAGHKSSYVGGGVGASGNSGSTRVNVEGVVTAIAANGFTIQDATGDGNASTSDGIFVFTNTSGTNYTTGQSLAVGSTVQILGARVDEFRPGSDLTITQLSISSSITGASIVNLGGSTAIAPVVLGTDRMIPTGAIASTGFATYNPALYAADFWESLEGMVVRVPQSTTISKTNEFRTSAGNNTAEGPPNEEIWVAIPGNYDASSQTPRGGLIISATDYNPERVQIDDIIPSLDLPNVDVGATLGPVNGVVNYDFGNYEVLVSQAPAVVTPSTLQKEVTALARDLRSITIGDYNVENLDPVTESTASGAVEGATLYARLGNSDTDDFAAHARHIVTNMGAPVIVSLQEVQDDDGATISSVLTSDLTLTTLVNAIKAVGGPTYSYAYFAPSASNINGGQPNANIRNAFLYQADLVTLDSTFLLDPTNAAFAASRKPLVGNFTFNGVSFTVINLHLSSKGGDDPLFGADQPPVLASETQRNQQAAVVNAYIDTLLAADPNARVAVMGDINDFTFSQPFKALTGESTGQTVLFDLAEALLPVNERYGYNFDGNTQELDHQLASASLLTTAAAQYDAAHVNSEFYDQVSDHDPSVSRFDLSAFGETLILTAAAETLDGAGGNDSIRGMDGNDSLSGGAGNDTLEGGGGDDVLDGGGGTDTAVFATARSANCLRYTDDSLLVVGAAGTDLLTGIETLLFNGVASAVNRAQLSMPTKDSLTLTAGNALSAAGNPAITISGATLPADAAAPFGPDPLNPVFQGVVIDNAGSIAATGTGARAIRITGSDTGARNLELINRAGGTITSQNDVVNIQPSITAGTIIVDNAGTIESTGVNGNNGQALDFSSVTAAGVAITITNAATGLLRAADSDAIRPGNGATLHNHGTIDGRNFQTNSGADGIDFQTNPGGTVYNYADATITGGRHGINHGQILGNTTAAITLNNWGMVEGRNGSGFGSDNAGIVENHGTIIGRPDTIPGVLNGDGDGVDIDYIGTVKNWGIIEGAGAKGVGSDGRPNTSQGVAFGGGTIENHAGARIGSTGDGVLVDDSSEGNAFAVTTIMNAGLIAGANGYGIRLISDWADRLTNSGTIAAGNLVAVDMGGGNDTVTLTGGQILGLVDGGAGADLLDLSAATHDLAVDLGAGTVTGTAWVSQIARFEVLRTGSGNDTLLGGTGGETLDGGLGADSILAGAGDDSVVFDPTDRVRDGGDGFDTLVVNVPVWINLTSPNQQVLSSSSVTRNFEAVDASAATGRVTMVGPWLLGGSGDDILGGTTGNDTLSGGGGADLLQGLEGDDVLTGGAGADLLYGGTGNDMLFGGTGDRLFGGAGDDAFVFDRADLAGYSFAPNSHGVFIFDLDGIGNGAGDDAIRLTGFDAASAYFTRVGQGYAYMGKYLQSYVVGDKFGDVTLMQVGVDPAAQAVSAVAGDFLFV